MPCSKRLIVEWPDELVIQLVRGPRSRRYIVPLRAGREVTLEMLAEPNGAEVQGSKFNVQGATLNLEHEP